MSSDFADFSCAESAGEKRDALIGIPSSLTLRLPNKSKHNCTVTARKLHYISIGDTMKATVVRSKKRTHTHTHINCVFAAFTRCTSGHWRESALWDLFGAYAAARWSWRGSFLKGGKFFSETSRVTGQFHIRDKSFVNADDVAVRRRQTERNCALHFHQFRRRLRCCVRVVTSVVCENGAFSLSFAAAARPPLCNLGSNVALHVKWRCGNNNSRACHAADFEAVTLLSYPRVKREQSSWQRWFLNARIVRDKRAIGKYCVWSI